VCGWGRRGALVAGFEVLETIGYALSALLALVAPWWQSAAGAYSDGRLGEEYENVDLQKVFEVEVEVQVEKPQSRRATSLL